MVFGILTAVVACPAIIGVTEGIRYGQKNNQREEHRGRKYHLSVKLLKRSAFYDPFFNGAPIVLKDNKFWVDTRSDLGANDEQFFLATTNYLAYPGMKDIWRKEGFAGGEGFVTWINSERFLNWVYVDRKTGEVKYGVRDEAEPHMVGPWDCTKIDRRLTFAGWEGFIVVEESPEADLWALYFDAEDNGLTSEGQIGNTDKRMLEVEVWRKEMRRDFDDSVNERIERMEERQKLGIVEQ